MTLRYAILHHTGHASEADHFDVLLELVAGGLLATWRSERWPVLAGLVLRRMGDHRRAYLDYEGPISGNRGRVRRVAGGRLEVTGHSDEIIDVVLDGERRMKLVKAEEAGCWVAMI